MGVDLKLFLNHDANSDPSRPYMAEGWMSSVGWFLSEPVRLERQRELWPAFEAAEARSGVVVPEVTAHEDEEGWVKQTTNPYGGALRSIPIREVVAAMESMEADLYPKNRAILAYMRALHPDARVLMWWC